MLLRKLCSTLGQRKSSPVPWMATLGRFCAMDRPGQEKHFRWLELRLITSTEGSSPVSFLPSSKKLTQGMSTKSRSLFPTLSSTTKPSTIYSIKTTITRWTFRKIAKDTSSWRDWQWSQQQTNKPPCKCFSRGKITEQLPSINWTRPVLVRIASSLSIWK